MPGQPALPILFFFYYSTHSARLFQLPLRTGRMGKETATFKSLLPPHPFLNSDHLPSFLKEKIRKTLTTIQRESKHLNTDLFKKKKKKKLLFGACQILVNGERAFIFGRQEKTGQPSNYSALPDAADYNTPHYTSGTDKKKNITMAISSFLLLLRRHPRYYINNIFI